MSRELPSSLAATPHLLHSSPSFFLSTLPFPLLSRETRKFFSIYSSNFYEGCKGYKEMFPLKKKRKNTIEKKLKLKIRIKIRANLLSVNWTIQFPGSGENNCSRPSSKIESLSLYIYLSVGWHAVLLDSVVGRRRRFSRLLPDREKSRPHLSSACARVI